LLDDPWPAIAALERLDVPELADSETTARVLRTAASTFRDYSVVATREAELRQELGRVPEAVATVPAFEDDVHDVKGLVGIGNSLFHAP
jgi:hypothetical protein